jgi:hypothetical protein
MICREPYNYLWLISVRCLCKLISIQNPSISHAHSLQVTKYFEKYVYLTRSYLLRSQPYLYVKYMNIRVSFGITGLISFLYTFWY